MTRYRHIAAALILLAAAGLSSEGAAQCVPPQEGQHLVEQGQVSPFPEALRRAGYSPNELAGSPQLCQTGSGWAYQVQIVRGGQVSTVMIPAR
jgi:hypothetical protein